VDQRDDGAGRVSQLEAEPDVDQDQHPGEEERLDPAARELLPDTGAHRLDPLEHHGHAERVGDTLDQIGREVSPLCLRHRDAQEEGAVLRVPEPDHDGVGVATVRQDRADPPLPDGSRLLRDTDLHDRSPVEVDPEHDAPNEDEQDRQDDRDDRDDREDARLANEVDLGTGTDELHVRSSAPAVPARAGDRP
jgi:hypothetical protein